MKIELEIDDQMTHQLCYAAYQAPADEATALTAARGAMNVLLRYAHMPEVVSDKHRAAMAVLRDQASARAVQFAKPGDTGFNVTRAAEELLTWMLRADY